MSKQNILYIAHYSELYGANKSLLSLLAQRKRLGFSDLVVLPAAGSFVGLLKELEVMYFIEPFFLSYHIPSNRKQPIYRLIRWVLNLIFRVRSFLSQQKASAKIAAKIKNSDLTLIHSNSSLHEVGYYLSEKLGLPHIWHIREFGDLDYGFIYNFSLARRKRHLKSAAKCIFVGDKLRKHFNYSSEKNGIVIRNGVFPKTYTENIDWEKERADLLMVGYLSQTKGQDIAIKAFACIHKKYPNKKLHIVGDGCQKYKTELKALTKDLNLDEHVIFHGFQTQMSDFYLLSKYTLMCSKNEAMGRVTPEAFAHGSVVIGIDNAGTAEMITHEKTGILFNGKESQLAHAVMELESNHEQYLMLRSSARDEFITHYTEEEYVHKISQIYKTHQNPK